MPLAPAITDIEQLKDHPAIAALLSWNKDAVRGVRWDRDELSIWVAREFIREACVLLRDRGVVNFLSDLTCADYYPRDPRFELAYQLLSHKRKEFVRLQVSLTGEDAVVESMTSVWAAANSFYRHVCEFFALRFLGDPRLRSRIPPER